jgi:hypothetical protein
MHGWASSTAQHYGVASRDIPAGASGWSHVEHCFIEATRRLEHSEALDESSIVASAPAPPFGDEFWSGI